MPSRIDSSLTVRRQQIYGGHQNASLIAILFIAFLFLCFELGQLPKNSVITTDELWGATLANLPFFKSIVFVLRFDVHPPLYYMQLNLWALAGIGDHWLQLNSVAWLLATAMIVWRLVRGHYNSLAALFAAAFALTSPSLTYYAFEVRMYTFLGFLTVLGLLFLEMLFETLARPEVPSRRYWIALFLVYMATCYSYATGPIIIIGHFCYGLFIAHQSQLHRRFFSRWIVLHALSGFLSLPVLANSMIRQIGHSALPDASDVMWSLAQLFAGFSVGQLSISVLSCFAVVGVTIIGFLLTAPNSRHLLISYLILPLLLAFVVSHAVKPLWLTRSFLFAVPVVGVAIGRCVGHWLTDAHALFARKHILIAVSAALISLQVAISYQGALAPKEPNYSTLAQALRTQARAGDCVIALSHMDVFWGIARYFVGPNWGDGLLVQAPADKRWATIMRSIPPRLGAFVGLFPRTDRLDYDGIHLISGFPRDAAGTCNRIFAIGTSADFTGSPTQISDGPVFAVSGVVTIRGPVVLR